MHKKRAAPRPPARTSSKKTNGNGNPTPPAEPNHENGNVANGHTADESSEPIDMELTILMPDGTSKQMTVLSNTVLMDLRMKLCAKYKLAPSSYTVEPLKSNDGGVISHTPSNTIGDLDCSVIKIKGTAKEAPKPVVHKLPEQTVRLTVKMSQSQKSVMRVNPRTPLSELFPQIATKSGANSTDHIDLVHPNDPGVKLDRNKSLDDYKIREVVVLNNEVTEAPVKVEPPVHETAETPPPEHNKHSDKKHSLRLTSLFKRSKKHKHADNAMSAAPSPQNQSPAPKHNDNNSNNSHQRTPSASDKPATKAPPSNPPKPDEHQVSAPVPASRNKRKAPVAPGGPVAPPRSGSTSSPSGATSPTEKHKKPAPKPPTRSSSSTSETTPTKTARSKSADSLKIDVSEQVEEEATKKPEEEVVMEDDKVFEVPDDTLQRQMAKATEEIDFALEQDEEVPTMTVESEDEEEVIDLTGELDKMKKADEEEKMEEEEMKPQLTVEEVVEVVKSEPVVEVKEETPQEYEEPAEEEAEPEEESKDEKEVIIIDKSELILEENISSKEEQTPQVPPKVEQVEEEPAKDEVVEDVKDSRMTLHVEHEEEETKHEDHDEIIHPESHYDPNFGMHAPLDDLDFMADEKLTPEEESTKEEEDAILEEKKEVIVIPAEDIGISLPPPPEEFDETPPPPIEEPASVVKQPDVEKEEPAPEQVSEDTTQQNTMEQDDEAAKTEREIEKLKMKIQRMKEKKRLEEEATYAIISDKSTTGPGKEQKTFTVVPRNRPKTYEDTKVAPVLGINISSSGELKSYQPTDEPAEIVEEELALMQASTEKEEEPKKQEEESPSDEKTTNEPERIVIDLKETETTKVEEVKPAPAPTKQADNPPKPKPAVAPPRQHHAVHTASAGSKSALPNYYKRFLQHSKAASFVTSAAKSQHKDTNKQSPGGDSKPVSPPPEPVVVETSKPVVSPPPTSPKPQVIPTKPTPPPISPKSTPVQETAKPPPVDGASKPTPNPEKKVTNPTSPHPPISPKPKHLITPTPKIIENSSFGSLPPPPEETKDESSSQIPEDLPPPPPEELMSGDEAEKKATSPVIETAPVPKSFFGATTARPFASTSFRPMSKSLKDGFEEMEDLNNNPLTIGDN